MDIRVQFEAQLRHVTGIDQADVSVPDSCSVAGALQAVAAKFGSALGERLIAPDGTTQRSVLLFVNEQAIPHDRATAHLLQPGDVLLLYPPISGG
ncbi:MAG: MoaD/ThiS family protein [Planctomycetaceae bacterium]